MTLAQAMASIQAGLDAAVRVLAPREAAAEAIAALTGVACQVRLGRAWSCRGCLSQPGPRRNMSRLVKPAARPTGDPSVCLQTYCQILTEEESMATNRFAQALQENSAALAPPRRRSGDGGRHIGGYFDPAVAKQLRVLAANEDRTITALLAEALDLLFESRGQPPIARQPGSSQ